MAGLVDLKFICVGFVLANFAEISWSEAEIPLLLLISFDGFRWDYLQLANRQGFKTPNFDRLISNGVVIGNGGLINVFVTKTLPNHYSLATGLYVENHGVVGNSFFDPVFNETFHYDNYSPSEGRKWWDGKTGASGMGAEPIWVTNDRLGGRRASGSYMFPGATVDHQRPFYTRCDSKKFNVAHGVDTIIEWFTDDLKPINFGMLYFGEPDHTGHLEGAGSREVLEKIAELDMALGRLIRSLEDHKLFERMNIILTSDHGMTNITRTIYLDEYVDPNLYRHFSGSPAWNVLPNEGKEDLVYELFKSIPNLTVYKQEDLPKELHYGRNRRVLTLVLTAPEGVRFCPSAETSWCNVTADHGYNNSLPSMHPIFIAHGPAFKKNYTSVPFSIVDLYPLMCHILRVMPHPNDGNLENVRQILDDSSNKSPTVGGTMTTLVTSICFAAIVSLGCCIAAFVSFRMYIRRKGKGRFFRRPDLHSLNLMEKKERGNEQLLMASEEEDFA